MSDIAHFSVIHTFTIKHSSVTHTFVTHCLELISSSPDSGNRLDKRFKILLLVACLRTRVPK